MALVRGFNGVITRADLIALRGQLEADPESEETQGIYDICREARLHNWDRQDPTGGGRRIVHRRTKRGVEEVKRVLMCYNCTTKRTGIYLNISTRSLPEGTLLGYYQYDHPKGYLAKDSGMEPRDLVVLRAAVFGRLPLVEHE